jgi:hypothetical protein
MTWLRRIGIGVGVVVVLYVVLLLAFQRHLLFPRGMIREPTETEVPGREVLWLSQDVEAWFLPGEGVTADNPGPLVIFAHGNGELIDFLPQHLRPYRVRGLSVLLVEYRGYGRSAGDPSEEAIVADHVEAYDLVTKRPEVDATRILFHGRSLGGGVVCGLSRERPPTAMILQSTFTSVPDVAPWWAAGILVQDPFDNIACVERFEGPILVLHGTADTLIPVENAHTLVEHAADATLVLDDAGHNDMPPHWEDIQSFVAVSL